MGWSCTQLAGATLRNASMRCRGMTGASNTWKHKGTEYFFETGKEQRDGAITGEVVKSLGNGLCRTVGRFRIAPNGEVASGPAHFRAICAPWFSELAAICGKPDAIRENFPAGIHYNGPKGGKVTVCPSFNSNGSLAYYTVTAFPVGCGFSVGTDCKTAMEAAKAVQTELPTV